jgi:uncharacterized protein YegP (UPF0339 family)
MAAFEISEHDDGTFTFDLKADDGQILMTSSSYTAKNDALLDIIAAKFAATTATLPPDFKNTMLHMV